MNWGLSKRFLTPEQRLFWQTIPLVVWQDLLEGRIALWAMSLVYSTLLSIVPLLALSFSVLKGFGVHNEMEAVLLGLLSPLGDKAGEVTAQVLGFVDNVQVGVLGVAGLVVLLYTVISLMGRVEEAFNFTWRVQKGRSLSRQFRDYLSVIMVGPILVFSALGLWSSLTNTSLVQNLAAIEPFGSWLAWLVSLTPTLLIILAFAFSYLFMPNTRVKPIAAFGGALIAGVLWQIASWMFAAFVVSSGQQTAIYSVFATLFLFVFWLNLGWTIVLLGSRLAYYFQHPDAVTHSQYPAEGISQQTRLLLALGILREIGGRFQNGQPPLDIEALRQVLPVSRYLLEEALDGLVNHQLLARDDQEPTHFLLLVAPEQLSLAEVRRRLWQGNPSQREQAEMIQHYLHLQDDWLESFVSPETSLQAFIARKSVI